MSIRSSVTVSLVPEAAGGPFVYWGDLAASTAQAAELGFDAIEVFPTDAQAGELGQLRDLLEKHQLSLAAMGTGAGWLRHRLTLVHPDPAARRRAIDFVRSIIDVAGPLGAPAIIGSMQGRHSEEVPVDRAFASLTEALDELGSHAAAYNVPLLYEPLNRYETNLCNTLAAGVDLLKRGSLSNVRLLADLFHMNIEEADMPASIRGAKSFIGHLHFVDTNRRAAGAGHLDFPPIVSALEAIGFDGFASAEALPLPTSGEAAAMTLRSYRRFFLHQT
ncbi:MAG: sugar phosphate isomerase/epimerase family protein [Isosphaeraceae bacterium]